MKEWGQFYLREWKKLQLISLSGEIKKKKIYIHEGPDAKFPERTQGEG